MRVVCRLHGNRLTLDGGSGGPREEPVLGDADRKRFEDWAATYRALVRRENREADLLELGKSIGDWLNGFAGWLSRLLDMPPQPPFVVEFQAAPVAADPGEAGALARAFLDVPWELLARGTGGHLAVDAILRYCPVRRLGHPAGSAPSKSKYRLGLVFMAASPRNTEPVLDFEAEENAIIAAAGTIGLDLEVEESGNPDRLAERLAEAGEIQALHLSCHGVAGDKPELLLEDEFGDELPTPAEGLISALGGRLPPLLFLSACETAQRGARGVADPLTLSLIRAGAPSVLGWDGSVLDDEATEFAHGLYKGLSLRWPLEEAAGAARRALLDPARPRPSRDWHLARLWLGPAGGGPLVFDKAKRRMQARDHGHKQFLDIRRQQSPVASREAFVGRRRELQASLRALRTDDRRGLLIHGMGRLGKSSLAARIAHRRPDLILSAVYGQYDAPAIVQAICDACPAAAPLLDPVKDAPERLEDALRAVLEDPCRQTGTGKPLLLVIDDLEQTLDLDAPGGDRRPFLPAHVETMRAALRAFALAETDSRLLLTSRYIFTLPDGGGTGRDLADSIEPLHLPPMDETGARKQALRQRQLRTSNGAAPPPALLTRCIASARGNPGLQNMLFDLAFTDPDAAMRALDDMDAYLEEGKEPGDEAVRAFLENLLLDRLLGLLSQSDRDVLRALSLFELPVPLSVVHRVAGLIGGGNGAVDRLLDLGLCDRFDDLVAPHTAAVAVNALIRPKVGHLADAETAALAVPATDALFATWGGAVGSKQRPYPADAELTRLALLAGSAPVLAACTADALQWLYRQSEYKQAADWGQRALALLDAQGTTAPLMLLKWTGDACVIVGEANPARDGYGRALNRIEGGEVVDGDEHVALLVSQARLLADSGAPDEAISVFERAQAIQAEAGRTRNAAVTLGEIARLRAQKGEVDDALRLHDEARQILEALGDRRERAIALGEIARLRAQKGEVDDALRLHEEAQRVYEALGDRRSRAVALGDIARLRAQKGEIDDALRLHEEELKIYEALGDPEGRANALWDIAQIELQRKAFDRAVPKLAEAYSILDRIGRLEGVCIVGVTLGQFLVTTGEREGGLAMLRRSEAGFRRLHMDAMAERVAAIIGKTETG
jgi:tetratricopeptide (TPR) repeat protein